GDSAKCVVSNMFSRCAISSQRRNKSLEAVNNACGARPQHGLWSAAIPRLRDRFESSPRRVRPLADADMSAHSKEDLSDLNAESTSSLVPSGARTSINSANQQVRIGAWTFETNSRKAVRFAIVVVPNLFASAKPSSIEARQSVGESLAFSALIALIQSANDFCGVILPRKQG